MFCIQILPGEKAFLIPLLKALDQSNISRLFEQDDSIPERIIKKGKKVLLEFLTMNNISIIHELEKNLGIEFRQVDSLFDKNRLIQENVYVSDNRSITGLSIFNQNLIHFPLEILQLKKLKHLCIHSCGLTIIPKTLSQLVNLQELYLGNNRITDISVLKNLSQLITLDLWNNRIIDISPLKDLSQLTILYLRQ